MKTLVEQDPSVAQVTDECCPEFHPELWDEKINYWNNKLFLKASVPEIFHIPLPGVYAKAITKMWAKAEAAGVAPPRKDFLLLAYDPSPFKGELYMYITKEMPGEDVVSLTGTFYSKVFDGPYNKVPRYIDETNAYLTGKGKKAKKFYFNFAYCPRCAKKYGHNYIVALAEV
jgi:hypothetical protein